MHKVHALSKKTGKQVVCEHRCTTQCKNVQKTVFKTELFGHFFASVCT